MRAGRCAIIFAFAAFLASALQPKWCVSSPLATHGYQLWDNCNVYPSSHGAKFGDNDRDGKDISINECMSSCSSTPWCQCVTYKQPTDKSVGKCWRRAFCYPSITRRGANGFQVYMNTTWRAEPVNNYYVWGTANVFPPNHGAIRSLGVLTASSANACKSICTDTSRCQCVTYRHSTNQCWMREGCNVANGLWESNLGSDFTVYVATRATTTTTTTTTTRMNNYDNTTDIATRLREQLVRVGLIIGNYSAPVSRLNSTCEMYCAGRAFAASCVPCSPDAFNNDSALCLKPGPLGTGLLCRANPYGYGNAVNEACCEQGMPCELPAPPAFPLNEFGLRDCGGCTNFPVAPILFPMLDDPLTFPEFMRQYDTETGTCNVSTQVAMANTDNVTNITRLREQLITASHVLGKYSAPVSRVSATCAMYCAGMAFAASCVPCLPDAFNNDSALCLKPGPLGTGLLCRADPHGNAVYEACCERGMPCELPGPPDFPLNEMGLRNCGGCKDFPLTPELFPMLDDPQTAPELRRQYVDDRCMAA